MRKTAIYAGILILMLAAFGSTSAGVSAEADDKSDVSTEQQATFVDSGRESEGIYKEARVSYLGPAGTYTEEAAVFFFPDAEQMLPEETVDDAIAMLENGEADFAVIPQENTIGGAVTNYVDALISRDELYVVGEVILPISQTLLGIQGASIEDIKTVCSHTQGISQSEEWRKQHMPDAETEEMASTAAAAEYVAAQQDKTIAAIAAPGAASLYGLTVLAENVQITDANKTRFYVLASEKRDGSGCTRAVFVADCEAEELDDIIITLHDAGLEMVTIHDRPEGSALGSYRYIIEVKDDGGITPEKIERVSAVQTVRYLGSFDMIEKN
ncbi:MAG: hypothetical protein IKE31_05945 [Eubacterium sp.]|nr:hypothetical protein [Eubacterium sp.]